MADSPGSPDNDSPKLPFRPGGLDLGGFEVLRTQTAHTAPHTADHLAWHIDLLSPNELDEHDLPFLVAADLHMVRDGWLAGVTVVSPVVLPRRYRVPDVPPGPLRDTIVRKFGETLWDACTLVLGQLAAMVRMSITLDRSMPVPSTDDDDDPCRRETPVDD